MSSRPATTFATLFAFAAVHYCLIAHAAPPGSSPGRVPGRASTRPVGDRPVVNRLDRSEIEAPRSTDHPLRPNYAARQRSAVKPLRLAGGRNLAGSRNIDEQPVDELSAGDSPDHDPADLDAAGGDLHEDDPSGDESPDDVSRDHDFAGEELADDDAGPESTADTPSRDPARTKRGLSPLLSGLPLLRGQAPGNSAQETSATNRFALPGSAKPSAFELQTAQRPPDANDINTWQPGVAPHQPWELESVDPAELYANEQPGIWSTDPSWSWHMLPVGILYGAYAAGEKESRLSSALLQEINGELWWDHVLGGRLGLVRFGNDNPLRPEGFQLDVEAAAFLRMQPLNELDVISTDFRFGLPLTYRRGKWQTKFGYYHISSHVGDEFQLKNPTFQRNNYARDALVFGMGYFPIEELRLYAEVGGAFHHIGGAQAWEVQTGFEYAQPQSTGFWPTPFYAVNGHFRQDVDWSGSLNVLAGIQWRSTTRQTLRIGLQYFNGANNQYVFLRDTQQLIGGTIRYDF